MTDMTLNDILGDFDANESAKSPGLKERSPVTIWLDPATKKRYDKLQEVSRRKFSKKVREVVLALISAAEARSA